MHKKNIKRQSNFVKLALFIISLVAVLFLPEILASIYAYFFYPRLVISDTELGWKYRPNSKKVVRYFNQDAVYNLSINSDGFRDDEFSKDRDCYRIMVLGDSMTFGLGVNQDEVFCYLLEKEIKRAHPDSKIDVMNFGISGFSTGQELLCLKKYSDIYPPNIVILMLFDQNDFEDNACIVSQGRYTPHFKLEKDKLAFENSPNRLEKIMTFLRDRSYVLYFLSTRLSMTDQFFSIKQNINEATKILLMQEILDEMFIYTNAKRVPLFIFYIRYKDSHNNFRFGEMKQYCIDKGIFFREIALVSSEQIKGISHWNKKGHISVATIIYNALESKSRFYGPKIFIDSVKN